MSEDPFHSRYFLRNSTMVLSTPKESGFQQTRQVWICGLYLISHFNTWFAKFLGSWSKYSAQRTELGEVLWNWEGDWDVFSPEIVLASDMHLCRSNTDIVTGIHIIYLIRYTIFSSEYLHSKVGIWCLKGTFWYILCIKLSAGHFPQWREALGTTRRPANYVFYTCSDLEPRDLSLSQEACHYTRWMHVDMWCLGRREVLPRSPKTRGSHNIS